MILFLFFKSRRLNSLLNVWKCEIIHCRPCISTGYFIQENNQKSIRYFRALTYARTFATLLNAWSINAVYLFAIEYCVHFEQSSDFASQFGFSFHLRMYVDVVFVSFDLVLTRFRCPSISGISSQTHQHLCTEFVLQIQLKWESMALVCCWNQINSQCKAKV